LKAFNLNQEQNPQPTPSPGTPLQAPPVLATGQGPSAAETEFKTPHPPQTTWGQSQPVLPDIEKMVRDHVANNQQHLSQQPAPQGSYSGPNMAEIRKDPNVQAQADLIMNAIKANCPVYGQNQPANPTLSGINPLQQQPGPYQQYPGQPGPGSIPPQQQPSLSQLLVQQISAQQPLGQQHYAQQQGSQTPQGQQACPQPPLADPSPQLSQLLCQLLTPQPTMQPQPQPIPQIPGNLIAGLAQLGPAAIPLLQSLQPQPNLTQQPGWTTPGHLGQATLQQGHLLQQFAGLLQGNHSSQVPLSVPGHPFQQVAYGQTTQNQGLLHPSPPNPLQQQLQQLLQTLQQPTINPQQNSLLGTPAATALSQRHSTPQQGMSSMTGVMVVRPTEYSRFCSVDYAKKVKADNCNLVLYIWGYVAQILASKQGHIPAIPEQEQIGRLQHLLHILELSAMQSSPTDFSSPAWLCARNYSDRVFQDLDSGSTSWSTIGPKMHPTNMMQAMSSHPKVTTPKVATVAARGLGLSGGGSALSGGDSMTGPLCSKWSSCEVENKCQYEVDNPGRTCNRPHYCTFCQKTFKQSRKHKEADCRKKASHSGTDQPTS